MKDKNTVLINNEQYVPKDKAKKRGIIIKAVALFVGFFVLLGVLCSGLFMLSSNQNSLKNELGGVYQRSFYELEDAVGSLEISLSKLLASNSDSQSVVLATEVYKNAAAASDALSRLPLPHDEVQDAEKYLNQVADFSLSFIKSMSYGSDSSSYRENIEELYVATRAVGELVGRESELISQNSNSFMRANKKRTTKSFDYDANVPKEEGSNEENNEQSSSFEYPSMIYDGPFSDSTSQRCYKALENLPTVSYEEAAAKVEKALPYAVSNLALAGQTNGQAPSYQIIATTDKGEVSCLVTIKGGVFLSVDLNMATDAENMTREAAYGLAKNYAKSFGYEVEPIWYNSIGGVATINLAPIENDVVYYTDLVKVKLSLSDGSFMGLEGTGYCMNHTKRAARSMAMMTTNGARSLISPRLNIISSRLAVIPDGEKELLAYEIVADYKDLEYYIYIDAETGKEINILRVVDEAQGKVTY